MSVPDRKSFAGRLEAALLAPQPAQRVSSVIGEVLTEEPSVTESEDQRLVRRISERVDVASADSARLLRLARDVQDLLDGTSSAEAVERLLELVAERARVLEIARKHAQGAITRTSFLSFVAEQRWPESVRRRMAALSPADLASLVAALEGNEIARLETLLVG